MSEETEKAGNQKQDTRISCRYGEKCYQKNPAHLTKYKHPSKNNKRKYNNKGALSKRIKLDKAEDKLENKQTGTEESNSDEEVSTSITIAKGPKKECVSPSDSEQSDTDNLIEFNKAEDKLGNKQTVTQENNSDEQVSTSITIGKDNKKECVSPSDSEQSDTDKLTKENDLSEKINPTENKDETNTKESVPEESNNEEPGNSNDTKKELSVEESFKNEPFNPKTFIKNRFLVDLPKDFYKFWDFCKQLKPAAPREALKDVGLQLVGPYDVLADKFRHIKRSPEEYLRHWRYYYDPPETLTVLKGDNSTGYHIGYFYDSPQEPPSFLVSNHGTKDGVFTKMGENIFSAVSLYLEDLKRTGDPFKKMRIGKLLGLIKTEADRLELNLSQNSKKMKERSFKVVTKTFSKIGLVVPYNKKTQLGYRGLAMEDKDLMSLLTKLDKASPEQKSKFLSDLQPVLTYANIALDECDFGTGVKLGWELIYHGIDSLNSTIAQFLSNSYRLLNKEAFAKIAEAHMSKRRKGCDLSIV